MESLVLEMEALRKQMDAELKALRKQMAAAAVLLGQPGKKKVRKN